jgi:hypothetical protein
MAKKKAPPRPVVAGPQLELAVKGAALTKALALRMPQALYDKFVAALAQEAKGAPPFAPVPTVTAAINGLIAEYAEFWLTVAETDAGKVLVAGLKRKGARRG